MEVSAPPWIMMLKVKVNLITTDNHQSPAWFLLASHLDESSCHDTQKAYFSPGTLQLVPLSALCSSSSYIIWIVSHPNWVPFNVSFLDPFGLELYKAAIIFLSYKLKRWAVITYCYITYNVNLCRMFHDNFRKSVVPGEGGGRCCSWKT